MEPLDLIISAKNQNTKSINKTKQIYYIPIIKFLKRKSRKKSYLQYLQILQKNKSNQGGKTSTMETFKYRRQHEKMKIHSYLQTDRTNIMANSILQKQPTY